MAFWTNTVYRPGPGGTQVCSALVTTPFGSGELTWVQHADTHYWFYSHHLHPFKGKRLVPVRDVSVAGAKRMCEALLATRVDLRD